MRAPCSEASHLHLPCLTLASTTCPIGPSSELTWTRMTCPSGPSGLSCLSLETNLSPQTKIKAQLHLRHTWQALLSLQTKQ